MPPLGNEIAELGELEDEPICVLPMHVKEEESDSPNHAEEDTIVIDEEADDFRFSLRLLIRRLLFVKN